MKVVIENGLIYCHICKHWFRDDAITGRLAAGTDSPVDRSRVKSGKAFHDYHKNAHKTCECHGCKAKRARREAKK